MLFSSQAFLFLFLPLSLLAYYAFAKSYTARITILTTLSLAFYGWWDPRFVPLLGGMILITWLVIRLYGMVRKPWILVIGLPGDDKAAIRKRRHRRVILVIVRLLIDPDLAADGVASGVIELAEDIVAAAAGRIIGTRCVVPRDKEAAAFKAGNTRAVLLAAGSGINQELVA